MSKQNKVSPMINKDFKINSYHDQKINMEIDSFIEGQEMEADRAASAKTTQIMYL